MKSDCEVIEFVPEHFHEEEMVCSFCGVPKHLAEGGFLVNGLEANICPKCLRGITKLMNGESEEDEDI